MPQESRNRFVALVVVPAVASSLGTYFITRALHERPPVRVAAHGAPAPAVTGATAATPLNLEDFVYPGAKNQGIGRSGNFITREYETQDSLGKVANFYRSRVSPSTRMDYTAGRNRSLFSAGTHINGVDVEASGRAQIDLEGNGHVIFHRRDASGVLTIVLLRGKGETTTSIVVSYASQPQQR